jgi:hypothetical protein
MRFILFTLLGFLSLWTPPQPAQAADAQLFCYQGPTNPQWAPCSASNPLSTSGSGGSSGGGGGTAAIAPGFVPNLSFATLTATASSASVALPSGFAVLFQNTGTTTVSCTLGIGSATATANELIIPASSPAVVVVGSNTWGACIDQTGSASNLVVLSGGAIQEHTDLAAINTSVQAQIPACTSSPCNIIGIAQAQSTPNVTPVACGGTVVTGGTAVNAFTAQSTLHGFTIANIDTSEVLWISFTTTALASDVGSYPLAPASATTFASLSSFTAPLGFGMNTALSVVAATNGHKFSCTRW